MTNSNVLCYVAYSGWINGLKMIGSGKWMGAIMLIFGVIFSLLAAAEFFLLVRVCTPIGAVSLRKTLLILKNPKVRMNRHLLPSEIATLKRLNLQML